MDPFWTQRSRAGQARPGSNVPSSHPLPNVYVRYARRYSPPRFTDSFYRTAESPTTPFRLPSRNVNPLSRAPRVSRKATPGGARCFPLSSKRIAPGRISFEGYRSKDIVRRHSRARTMVPLFISYSLEVFRLLIGQFSRENPSKRRQRGRSRRSSRQSVSFCLVVSCGRSWIRISSSSNNRPVESGNHGASRRRVRPPYLALSICVDPKNCRR